MAKTLPPVHEPCVAKPQGGLHLHYSTHNWSDSYLCPTCGLARRYNSNFLGTKMVVCTGAKFITVPKDPPMALVRELAAQGTNLEPMLRRIYEQTKAAAKAMGVS